MTSEIDLIRQHISELYKENTYNNEYLEALDDVLDFIDELESKLEGY